MLKLSNVALIASLVLLSVGTATAQFGRGPGMRVPTIRGVINPIVGSGAVYQTSNGEVEITLVGKEDVAGKQGLWIQIGMKSPEGQMYMKQLTVVDGKTLTISRVVVQPPQGNAMEMPPGMLGATTASADVSADGELVGTESIVTPAGTFSTQHYKGAGWETWVAANAPPWGLVKSKDATGEMTLVRTITDAPDRIKGTPQKLEIPGGFPNIPRGRIPGQ
jgi:hypothetical protein